MTGKEYERMQKAARCIGCDKEATPNSDGRCERCEIERRNAMQRVERLDQGKKPKKP